MSMTDPVADMLTRIRNANHAGHEKVDIPASKLKTNIAGILKKEKFIKSYKSIEDHKQGTIRVYLKYGTKNERILTNLKRISKPGLRVYVDSDNIPKVVGGLGIAVISTSKGVMTDIACRKLGIGGEVICYVW
ncbi:MAG: 30S ribosomal protein S8 [Nitrospirota bacterium]